MIVSAGNAIRRWKGIQMSGRIILRLPIGGEEPADDGPMNVTGAYNKIVHIAKGGMVWCGP